METEKKFKIGDSVKLKSGGSDMTINEAMIKPGTDLFTGYYRCIWFVGQ